MLKLKNICKSYKIGKEKHIILDNITLDFFSHELVFILGASGSGKSTLLNIIAGNLKCDSGSIYLNNLCINKLNDKNMNAYRGLIVSNIFQDYNLIENMSIYDNIKVKCNRRIYKRNISVLLKQLGLYEKRNILVSKLSGGEKQRVAIARAIVNNPKIILADEPTGALDTNNGVQIMEILKRLSEKKLVIVVSHDVNLANKYASRIINIKDGKCSYYPTLYDESTKDNIEIKKYRFKLIRIIKLAIKNLWIKKGRTLFTSLAISLGFISMFLVLNLAYNFDSELKRLEEDVVSLFPISISNLEIEDNNNIRKSNNKIIFNDESTYTNKISNKYIDYVSRLDGISHIVYGYDMIMPVMSDKYKFIDNKYMNVIPNKEYIVDNYEFIYGRNTINNYEVLLVVDSNNNVDGKLLHYFDIDNDIEYSEIIGRELKIIMNDDYFREEGNYFVINDDYSSMYQNSNIVLTIVGIVREKEAIYDKSGIYYDKSINDILINKNTNSKIVNSQLIKDYNVLGIMTNREEMLSYLGYNTVPNKIDIYPNTIDNHDKIISLLDKYNDNNDKVIYTDLMKNNIDMVKDFIKIMSVILIAFSLITTLVGSLMIGILTSIRVLERRKEIGILRSLGASKGNIVSIFNIENLLIGIISFGLSILIILFIKKPINIILENTMGVNDVFKIKYNLLLLVFIINNMITTFSGIIPAIRASKLDIVKCIYNR